MRQLALLLALASAAMAQDIPQGPDFTDADGATLRFLDKLTSDTGDIDLSLGESATVGRLIIQLDQCRYPTANAAADSEARLTIVDQATGAVLFSGWMLASVPALSALDHPRYDIWVLSCDLPAGASAATTPQGEGE